MSNNRYTTKQESLKKLAALRDEFSRLASDAAYKRRVIQEARERDADWDYIKANTRPLRQGRLFR